MSELKKTTIYLTAETKKKIKKASYLTDRTITDIINSILEKGIDEYLKEVEEE